eukprot:1162074-Pelagomonas_calceolata.AAC.2
MHTYTHIAVCHILPLHSYRSKKGSPLRGTEVEDYATDKSGASPGPGRSGRIPLPSHGLNSVVTRAPNRPPIFI